MRLCLCMQASIAKLETSVSYVGDMLELKVYGFNEKLPILLSKVLSVARSFIPTDDRFKVYHMFLLISPKMSILLSFFPSIVLTSDCFICCNGSMLVWTGYKRRHEEGFKEHQHETSKPFIIFETANFVWELLWRWGEVALSEWFVSWWSECIYPWASLWGRHEIFNITILAICSLYCLLIMIASEELT